MSELVSDHGREREITWDIFIGPSMRFSDLPRSTQEHPGLIAFRNGDDIKVCPVRQFDPCVIDEDGMIALVVDKWVGLAWEITKLHGCGESDSSLRSAAAALLSHLRSGGKSFATRIFECPDEASKERLVREYASASMSAADQAIKWPEIDIGSDKAIE